MDMIQSIREAFNELLNENHWMDDQTRIVAKAKADAMKERIGYPEVLTDPDELEKEYIMVYIKRIGIIFFIDYIFLHIFS